MTKTNAVDINNLKKLITINNAINKFSIDVLTSIDDYLANKGIFKPVSPIKEGIYPKYKIHSIEEFYIKKDYKRDKKHLIPLIIGIVLIFYSFVGMVFPGSISILSNPNNGLGMFLFVTSIIATLVGVGITILGINKLIKSKKEYESFVNNEKEKENSAIKELKSINDFERKAFDEQMSIVNTDYDKKLKAYQNNLKKYESEIEKYTDEYNDFINNANEQIEDCKDYFNQSCKEYFPNKYIQRNGLNTYLKLLTNNYVQTIDEAIERYDEMFEECRNCLKHGDCKYSNNRIDKCYNFVEKN